MTYQIAWVNVLIVFSYLMYELCNRKKYVFYTGNILSLLLPLFIPYEPSYYINFDKPLIARIVLWVLLFAEIGIVWYLFLKQNYFENKRWIKIKK